MVGPWRASLELQWVDDDLCVYDPETDRVLVLNGSASTVMELSDGTRSRDEIVAEVARLYEQPPERIRDDVERAIRGLRESRLLE